MTARITSLTPEQWAEIDRVRDRWLAAGFSTEPADRPAAEAGVRTAYAAVGAEPPLAILWVDSPLAGAYARVLVPLMLGASPAKDQLGGQLWGQLWDQLRGQLWDQLGDQLGDQLRDQLWDQLWDQLGDQLGGQLWDQLRGQLGDRLGDQLGGWSSGLIDAPWLQVYSGWFEGGHVAGVTGLDRWDGHAAVGASAGWWWAFPTFAILTERPTEIHRDAQGRLHSETGPALLWRDGWSTHAWHGTRTPADLIEVGWDTRRIFEEPNAEIRRCAIERTGWDRFVTDSGMTLVAESPDPGNYPHLLRLYDLPAQLKDMYSEPARVLLVTNGSEERSGERRRFGLPVPARHTDAVAAAADLYGIPAAEYRRISVRR